MVTTRPAKYDDFEVVSRLLTELGRTPLDGGNEEWFRSIYRTQIEIPRAATLWRSWTDPSSGSARCTSGTA